MVFKYRSNSNFQRIKEEELKTDSPRLFVELTTGQSLQLFQLPVKLLYGKSHYVVEAA